MSSNKQSSYSAFSEVDALVSKPVLGSDGAAKWQDFAKQSKSTQSRNTAPSLPMKRNDKFAFQTLEEERRHENKIRKEAGDESSGYVAFKRKGMEDHQENKRRKLIIDRVRPEKTKYYIAAATFEGWKEDYIFTTRDRGTGYYWDGMDSVKKLNNGEDTGSTYDKEGEVTTQSTQSGSSISPTIDESKAKKKTKKKKKKGSSKKADDTSTVNGAIDVQGVDMSLLSPMEQVQMALRRRNERISKPSSTVTSSNNNDDTAFLRGNFQPNLSSMAKPTSNAWEKVTDPSSGKVYYFNRSTGVRQWNDPNANLSSMAKPTSNAWEKATDPSSGKVYYFNRSTGVRQWNDPNAANENGDNASQN